MSERHSDEEMYSNAVLRRTFEIETKHMLTDVSDKLFRNPEMEKLCKVSQRKKMLSATKRSTLFFTSQLMKFCVFPCG